MIPSGAPEQVVRTIAEGSRALLSSGIKDHTDALR